MDTPQSDVTMWSGSPSVPPAPEFKTARRGFDKSQVLEHIGGMTARLKTAEDLVRQLRSEVEQAKQQRDTAIRERDAVVQQRDAALRARDTALQERTSADGEAYEQVSGRVTGLLVALDRDVEKIRAEAEAESEQIMAGARSEAYRVQRESEDARTAAALAAGRAREEAERSLADLTSQRDDMLGELRRTCSNFLDVVGRLAASIEGVRAATQAGNGSGRGADTSAPADRTVVLPEAVPDRPA